MKYSFAKKFTALALAGIMIFATACGNNAEATQETETITPQQTQGSNEGATTTDDDMFANARDLGGRVIRILNWEETYDFLPGMPEPDPNTSDDYFSDRLRWEQINRVAEAFNVTFENVVVDFEEVLDLLTTSVMSGSPIADIVMLDNAMILPAILGNLIVPFDDFVPANHDLFTTQIHAWPTAELNYQTWTIRERRLLDDGHFLGVNMDIINAIGAPNPVELYERGEWTFDAFLEITQMATRDTTGDGTIDQFGISGVLTDIVLGLIAANGGRLVTDDLNYGFDDPATMRALETVFELVNVQGAWDFDPETGEFWDWWRNAFAFMEGNAAFFAAQIYMLPEAADRTFTYAAVPFPIGPDNVDGTTFMSGFISGFGIPRGVENPEDVFEVWYLLNHWYGDDLELKDEVDLIYPLSRFMTEADGMRIMNNIVNNRRIDPGMTVMLDGIGYHWMAGSIAETFYWGTETPASIVEARRPDQQAMLDAVFRDLR